MSSTVTTATITSVTSVTSVAIAASLALVLIVALLVFLIQREVLVASSGGRLAAWRKALDVAIVPLAMGFGLIVVIRVIETLGR